MRTWSEHNKLEPKLIITFMNTCHCQAFRKCLWNEVAFGSRKWKPTQCRNDRLHPGRDQVRTHSSREQAEQGSAGTQPGTVGIYSVFQQHPESPGNVPAPPSSPVPPPRRPPFSSPWALSPHAAVRALRWVPSSWGEGRVVSLSPSSATQAYLHSCVDGVQCFLPSPTGQTYAEWEKTGRKKTVKESCCSDKGKESNPSPLGKATIAGSHAFYLFILTFAAIYQVQEAGPGLSWLSSLHPPSVHTAETPFRHPAHPAPTVGTGRGRRGPRYQEHAADGKAATTDSQGLPL